MKLVAPALALVLAAVLPANPPSANDICCTSCRLRSTSDMTRRRCAVAAAGLEARGWNHFRSQNSDMPSMCNSITKKRQINKYKVISINIKNTIKIYSTMRVGLPMKAKAGIAAVAAMVSSLEARIYKTNTEYYLLVLTQYGHV